MATEQIDKLLLLWQDCRQQGRAAPADELCRGCPELLPELEKRIAALEQLDGCASATTVKVSATAPKHTGAGEWPHVAGYILEAELGRGGMGVVYRAHQLGAERTVALKMISGPAWPGSAEVERFRREARLLASLQHPNIVQVFEVGEHDGLPFFSMEFVAGGALGRRLERQPLPPADAAPLVATVARAVHTAHEKGILHRDLKPSNILLACDPLAGFTPKVADFGLAKNVEQDEGQTPSGVILGTPSYMAPEQARGVKELTRASDVYALGAILYELLTGRPPFKAGTTHETMLAVLLDEPKSPRALRPDVPRVLEAVCLKCLDKDPTRRYATAAELADDLECWGRNEPTRARPEGRLRATWRWLRRYSKATLATATLLVVLLVLFLFPSSSPERRRKDALRDLAAGRPVSWLGEVGPPPWLHWAAGEDKAAASRNPRQPFALETLSIALAEMLPESPSDRYRFRVQVKHEDAEADGVAGIYFGHQSYETPQGVEHYFFELAFSDRAPGGEQLPLALRFRRYREGEGDKNNRKHLIRLKKVAVAPPHPGDSWHELTVEVTPARVRALDGGTLIGEVSTAELNRQIQAWLALNAHERGAYPRFDPRSGLGLYIYRGVAQFRSALLDPNVEDR